MKHFTTCCDNNSDILNPFGNRCIPPTIIFQFQSCPYTSATAVFSVILVVEAALLQTNLTEKVTLFLPAQG